MKEIIGSSKLEGIDYVQEFLGECTPRFAAEICYLNLVKKQIIVENDGKIILTKVLNEYDLREDTVKLVKTKDEEAMKSRPRINTRRRGGGGMVSRVVHRNEAMNSRINKSKDGTSKMLGVINPGEDARRENDE